MRKALPRLLWAGAKSGWDSVARRKNDAGLLDGSLFHEEGTEVVGGVDGFDGASVERLPATVARIR